jgi:hypothetical protein
MTAHLGANPFDRRAKQRQKKPLVRGLAHLGYDVELDSFTIVSP